ncbi:MAG: hypothetical protein IPM23_07565 [Candidatus Melainabacteria bacterium]|nr:hypothetical protein [Candidatus Melainabacteria bacterium]
MRILASCLKAVAHALLAVALVCAAAAVMAVVMGHAWELVCFMRSYGSVHALSATSMTLEPRDFHNQFLNSVASLLDLYNITFPNNMRYGSGLGLIAGALIMLASLPVLTQSAWRHAAVRFSAGAAAGAIAGGRLDLMVNSDPVPFLVTVVLFALVSGAAVLKAPERKPHVGKLLASLEKRSI